MLMVRIPFTSCSLLNSEDTGSFVYIVLNLRRSVVSSPSPIESFVPFIPSDSLKTDFASELVGEQSG